MRTNLFISCLIAVTLLSACKNGGTNKEAVIQIQEQEKDTAPIVVDGHNAQSSLDWVGTYSNDTLSLTIKEDMVYVKVTSTTSETGEFAWDTGGFIIALVNDSGNMELFKVEENRITDGGDLILTKQ